MPVLLVCTARTYPWTLVGGRTPPRFLLCTGLRTVVHAGFAGPSLSTTAGQLDDRVDAPGTSAIYDMLASVREALPHLDAEPEPADSQVHGHCHGFGHVLQPIFNALDEKWAADVALRRRVDEQRAGAFDAGVEAARTSLREGEAGKVNGIRVTWRTVPVTASLAADILPRLISQLTALEKAGMLEHDGARDANFLVRSPSCP